jgi:NADH:ubiquinone oxidoreductase subunit 5 (subunit L)/multisubunit Na+/H+ antiporter MnhA subunit
MRNEGSGVSGLSLLLATFGLLSAMILIANVGSTELGGDQYDPSDTIDEITTALFPIASVLWVTMIIYLFYNFFTKRQGKAFKQEKGSNDDQRWLILVPIICLAIGLGLILYSGTLGGEMLTPTPDDGNNDRPDPGSEGETPGPQFTAGSLVGLAIIMVVLLVPVLRYLHGQRTFARTVPPRRQEWKHAQVIDEAMAGIGRSTGDELRDAIIGAYHAMCTLLPLGPSDIRALTPREFATRAIEVLGWPAGPVNELTGIFELARYSHHPLGEVERERSLVCLSQIQEALGQGVSGPAGTTQPSEG